MQISGRAWIMGDGIDTDLLAPGAYMSGSIDTLASHCLEALRPDFAGAVRPGDIIIAGASFGIGSSREQAAEALKHLGIRAIIARSLGGIFQRNALNLGLPALSCPALNLDGIDEFTSTDIDIAAGSLKIGERQFATEAMPDFLLSMIADGGMLAHLSRQHAASTTDSKGDIK